MNTSELENLLRSEGEIVVDRLSAWARATPGRVFLYYGEEDRAVTFAEFEELTNRIARNLAALGVRKGDRVALFLKNPFVTALGMFAIWKLGAVYCPVNFNLAGKLLAYQLQDLAPRLAITEQGMARTLAEASEALPRVPTIVHEPLRGDHDFDPAVANGGVLRRASFAELMTGDSSPLATPIGGPDPASVIYTSGTTGPSKGVLQSHRWINQLTFNPRHLVDRDDVIYNDLPLYHIAGAISNIGRAAWAGCEVALWDRFSSRDFWSRIARRGATNAILIDVMIRWIASAPENPADRFNTLHLVNIVPVPADHHRLARRFGFDILATAFGQTEAGCPILGLVDECGSGEGTPAELYRGLAKDEIFDFARRMGYPVVDGSADIRRGFMGKVSPFFEVAILDRDDHELPPERPGQLAVRGRLPSLILDEYLNKPDATREALRGGWFHTGDSVVRDAEGVLYYVDRMGSSIRRRGENVSPYEVEDLVNQHPDVAMSAAVAIPAAEGNEDDIAVFVVLKPGAAFREEALLEWCRSALPRHMWPQHVRALLELPRTPTNKIEKFKLREAILTELEREGAGHAAS
jgi:crotonobetaine/carnitine-CoA ligase